MPSFMTLPLSMVMVLTGAMIFTKLGTPFNSQDNDFKTLNLKKIWATRLLQPHAQLLHETFLQGL